MLAREQWHSILNSVLKITVQKKTTFYFLHVLSESIFPSIPSPLSFLKVLDNKPLWTMELYISGTCLFCHNMASYTVFLFAAKLIL